MRILISLFALLPVLLVSPCRLEAVVLFEADFDDGIADGFTPMGPGWQVVDGAYTCETIGFGILSYSVFGSPQWRDYSVVYRVKADIGPDHMLFFRMADADNYYGLVLRSVPYNDIVLARTVDGERQFIAEAQVPLFDNGQWHDVQVLANGHQLDVMFNGLSVLSHHDDSEPPEVREGMCAVVSYSGGLTQHQIIWFDDILVEEILGPVRTTLNSWTAVKMLFE